MRHLTEPQHCAACYGQNEGGGIDFEAAFDGPVLSSAPQPYVAIDELFICSKCLRAAAKQLDPPLVNAPDLLAENERLLAKIEELEGYDTRNVKVIADLQRANDELVTRAGGEPGPVAKHAREVAAESKRLRAEKEAQAGPIQPREAVPA